MVDETAPRGGVVVVDGYDIAVRVVRNRLEVVDGVGTQRRTRRFHRATGGVRRLALLTSSGAVTLEALRWLSDTRASFVQLDRRGRVIATFGPPGTDRPALRRAQAMAGGSPVGVELARTLVDAKLGAQIETLLTFAGQVDVEDAVAAVTDQRGLLPQARSVPEIRVCEAWAAAAYWIALSALPVSFARRDVDRVPDHWRTVGSRSSALANGPRLAVTPAHAVVNYLAGCLAAEAVLAARVVGMDAGLGVLHVDSAHRDSLAFDLVEPARPVMEAAALEFLTTRRFAARDFVERPSGQCRLTAPLTHELAETLPRWRELVGRVAEDFAAALASGKVPTPISGRRRAAGRPGRARTRVEAPVKAGGCSWCGAPTEGQRRTCGEACEKEVLAQVHEQFARTSSQRQRGMDRRNHPALTEEANRKRRATRKAQREAELAWEREHAKPRPLAFEAIRPKLTGLSARQLAATTGTSVAYWSRIKRGERTPHPRWWNVVDSLEEKRPESTDERYR